MNFREEALKGGGEEKMSHLKRLRVEKRELLFKFLKIKNFKIFSIC